MGLGSSDSLVSSIALLKIFHQACLEKVSRSIPCRFCSNNWQENIPFMGIFLVPFAAKKWLNLSIYCCHSSCELLNSWIRTDTFVISSSFSVDPSNVRCHMSYLIHYHAYRTVTLEQSLSNCPITVMCNLINQVALLEKPVGTSTVTTQ